MTTQPPTPGDAVDAATFMAELRRLKAWSGLSFRQLERRAADHGTFLSYSTACTMLNKDRLPRPEVLSAFVQACGLDEAAAQEWLDAHTRIATGRPAASAAAAQDGGAVGVDGAVREAGVGAGWLVRRREGWRVRRRVAGAVAVVMVAFGAGLGVAGAEGGGTQEETVVVGAP